MGQNWWVFSAIPHLELGKILLPKRLGLVLGQISVRLGKWLFRRPQENQACSDAADAGLGVSADAADAGRMLLMLVVSWPRCACFSSILALGVLQHVCLSMFGDKLVCWVKTCFSPVAVFVWQGSKLHLLTCWIKTAPASVVLCNFLSAAMRACSCSFVTMAASVRSKLKLGISECCCVASPAPARAFVPARGSQVRLNVARIAMIRPMTKIKRVGPTARILA